jgi:hypothetical protein
VRASTSCCVAVVVVLLAGCGGDGEPAARDGTPAPVASEPDDRAGAATPAAGDEAGPCAPAPVRSNAPPEWAGLPEVPPPPMPYAIDPSEQVAAFFFTHPLKARTPRGVRNKILWIVGRTPEAERLVITAQSAGRTVRSSGDAGGGSGQIQRTTIRFPEPGCWRLDLRWGERRARLDVRVA